MWSLEFVVACVRITPPNNTYGIAMGTLKAAAAHHNNRHCYPAKRNLYRIIDCWIHFDIFMSKDAFSCSIHVHSVYYRISSLCLLRIPFNPLSPAVSSSPFRSLDPSSPKYSTILIYRKRPSIGTCSLLFNNYLIFDPSSLRWVLHWIIYSSSWGNLHFTKT